MALHKPACHATLLTAQAGIGSLDSCFSSTDVLELMQDTDGQRRPAEDWASVRQVATVRMSQLLTCPPSANARDSRHPHPPGLAPQGRDGDLPPRLQTQHLHQPSGHHTAERSSAPVGKRGSCSPPQTLSGWGWGWGWGGEPRPAQRTSSTAPSLGGHVVESWDKVRGPDWLSWEIAGPRSLGLAWACRCREGFTRPPQASRGMSGPGTGPTLPGRAGTS